VPCRALTTSCCGPTTVDVPRARLRGGRPDGRVAQRGAAELSAPHGPLRTTNALEGINEEFRRRTKAQASLPTQDAVLLLPSPPSVRSRGLS
jgi:hypothetical protein